MATTETRFNGRGRILSPAARSRLEQDVAEIKAQLGALATKDDVEGVKRHVDSCTADILEAIHGKDTLNGTIG